MCISLNWKNTYGRLMFDPKLQSQALTAAYSRSSKFSSQIPRKSNTCILIQQTLWRSLQWGSTTAYCNQSFSLISLASYSTALTPAELEIQQNETNRENQTLDLEESLSILQYFFEETADMILLMSHICRNA